MQTHNLPQGSPEWLAHRASIFNASEAPAMMGASKYQTRAELLHQKATGITPEVSSATQALFNRGHAAEAAARPMIEDYLGDDLAPQVGTVEIDGMTIGASFDGITMMQDTVAEVKLWNEQLAEQVRAGILDMHYVWQLEQELLVSGAQRVIFVTTDGTPERFAHMEYRAVPGRREQLIAGWKQFQADLATYTPPPPVEKIVAEPVEMLPAPTVQVSGTLALADNFATFETRLRAFLADKLIRNPQTDQDFADLDAQIKVMKDARAQLKAAEAQMLAQVQPIDQAKRTKDMLDKLLQQNVSMAEKILSDEKERRKGEIVAGAVTALRDHVAKLNARLGQPFMPATVTAVDFGSCIKGLRSLASMEDKISSMLAAAKIAANDTADKIDVNLKALPALVGDRTGITPDLAVLVLKPAEDFAAQVSQRVAQQKAAEERRAAELAERERERIRAEEAARLQREEQERVIAETRERAAKQQAEEAQRRADQAEKERLTRSAPEEKLVGGSYKPPRFDAENFGVATIDVAYPPAAPAAPLSTGPANVVPMPTKAPAAPAGAPSLTLGALNKRLRLLAVTAADLRDLGFESAGRQGDAVLYHEASFAPICEALMAHLAAVRDQKAAA